MDYENFKEQFVEDVKEKLYEQGTEVDITINTVNKLNESYEAMTVKPKGSNIGVNIGIDKFYGATQDGISYDDVVDKAVKAISDGFINQQWKCTTIKTNDWDNKEYAKLWRKELTACERSIRKPKDRYQRQR